jgi:transketolase
MWKGFGWHVIKADGHDVCALCNAFDDCHNVQAPCVVLAQTVKGKGVGFMENNRLWHHGALTQEQYEIAMREVQL